MANYPQKVKMKTAMQSASKKFNLSHVHVTTASAMRPIVAAVRDTIPNENGAVAVKPFVKLNPLNVPVFGECNMHLNYFQVPIRVVAPQFNDFINDTTHCCPSGGYVIPSELPYFTGIQIRDILCQPDYSTVTTALNFDFLDGQDKRVFTSRGSHAWQLLCSLGYNVPFDDKDTHFSAIRLLAYAKVYSDWFYNSQYADTSLDIFTVRSLFAKDFVTPYQVTIGEIKAILDMAEYVNYEADYFTAVWDKPYSPNLTNSSAFTFDDYQTPAGTTQSHYYPGEWVPLVTSNVLTDSQNVQKVSFSQYMMDSLKSLTDYLKRNQMSGTYSIDRYLARFGALLSSEKLQRSRLLGQENVPVKIGEVISTADTSSASLGSFAGKGIISSDGQLVNYSSDEYTVVLVIATIVPRHFYFQGLDRNILHREKGDYFTPEFDNLGVQSVSKSEILVDQTSVTFNDKQVVVRSFGYAPRYAEYKRGRDVVSGQFMNLSTSEQLRAWYFGRYLNPNDYTLDSLVHSPDFVSAKDASQYERIFQVADTDNYNIIFTNDWTAQMRALPLFDTYEFNSKGDDIIMDTNGVKKN